MNLRHDNVGRSIDGGLETKRDRKTSDEKKREFGFFKAAFEYCKSHTRVLAIAVSATAFAYCGSPKYNIGDADETDTQEEADVENDTELPDVEPDEITDPIEEDVIEDPVEEDVIEEEELPEPTCFEIPVAIDPTTDPLLNNSGSQDAVFNNTGPETVDADVETNVSMTGYPSVNLGVCPDDSNAYAFVANPDTVISFAADVSMEAGSASWSAEVPDMSGITCPELTPDSETLVAKNDRHQQVPKNADMSGTTTHAGFDLMPVTSTLVAYDKDGVVGTDGTLTVTGSDFTSPNTISALVLDGDVDVEVEVRAGESSDNHTYTATITGTSSKEARIYATDGDQMYEVSWNTGGQLWCARCAGRESFDLVISGDLLCKIADSCGCVGDGFDITVLGAGIDTSTVPPHLRGLHTVSDPLVSTTVGVSALSDPASDHPSITVRLEKGSVSFDDGAIVNFDVTVNAQLTSEHQNPDGTYDTRTVAIVIRLTDPWAWGSLEPTYATRCGCTPVY